MTTGPATLLLLLDVHQVLDELFLAHQTALLDRNLTSANAALGQFAAQLAQHIEDEEAHILPVYAARVTAPEGAKVEFFQMEHRKLQRVLGDLQAMLLLVEPSNAKSIIELLDKEASFKDLFRHHDSRERTFLYPLLAATLSPAEQSEILERINQPSKP